VALRIGAEVAAGLHAVHETAGPDGQPLQLIHRDISPQNVLIGFDGLARVTDFGIAKALGRATRTTTGVLKGKLGYLAPERLRFEEPDRRADLFSFGVVLFELLAGRRLYDSADEEGPRRILNQPPPDLADDRDDAEPELIELLFELLAKDPAARPAHAGLVARRLEQLSAAAVAVHGPTDTGGYLAHLFARERAALRERLSKVALGGPSAMPPARRASRIPTWLRRSALVGGAVIIAVLAITAAAHTPARRARNGVGVLLRPEPARAAASATPAQPSGEGGPGPRAEGEDRFEAAAVAPTEPSASAPSVDVAHRPRHRSRTGPPRPIASRSRRADGAPAGCDPPYTVNAAGERQFKLRCLVDVRR